MEVSRGPIQASATYYWSDSDKGQLLVLVGDVFEVQRQRIEIEGIELNLTTATPIPGLRLGFGYAHQHVAVAHHQPSLFDADRFLALHRLEFLVDALARSAQQLGQFFLRQLQANAHLAAI